MTRRPPNYLVLRGFYGDQYRDNYLNYLRGLSERGQNIGTQGNRPDSIGLFVQPFGMSATVNIRAEVSALVPSYQLLNGFAGITSRVGDTVGANEPVKLGGFKAARIIRRSFSSGQGVREVSKRTGLPYLKYNTESASVPIGRKDATDTITEAFAEIEPQVKGGQANVKVYLQEEDI